MFKRRFITDAREEQEELEKLIKFIGEYAAEILKSKESALNFLRRLDIDVETGYPIMGRKNES